VIPLSLGLDALRQILFGTAAMGLLPVWAEIVLLAVSVPVFTVLAIVFMRGLEERAKREGRLTLRWQ